MNEYVAPCVSSVEALGMGDDKLVVEESFPVWGRLKVEVEGRQGWQGSLLW